MSPQKILNSAQIATTDLRKDALMIAEAGYAAIDTGRAIRERLSIQGDTLSFGMYRYPITGRIRFVGIGKCAIAAAQAVEEILGERLSDGIALDVSPLAGVRLGKVAAYIGTHPHPTDINLEATERIMEFLAGGREDDLVLMLVSGGGSTLLCLHDAPMTCMDESVLLDELTRRGVAIEDINAVRKHLSKARGGGLAAAAYPARVVALIVSDVPGDDLASIASGPTIKDETTAAHALEMLARHGITPPPGAIFLETPKDDRYFERVDNILFLSSQDALAAMQERARDCGYTPVIVDAAVRGEASELG
ncbi:MAG TPA: DUF4147 domain-containing protein, partial [Candidatus Paceibacterota bacterium]|nr:DUF4147 domain-containing protein [Candidatus Paceibacterota bacterium]